MTAAEFTKIIGLIRGAFPRMDRFGDSDVKDVWFECLEDLDYTDARMATLNAIKDAKEFPPTIAEIRKEYKVLTGERQRAKGEIMRIYDKARSYYPACGEYGYGWKEFLERADTPGKAEKLCNAIMRYVDKCTDSVMDFVECIKTVEV